MARIMLLAALLPAIYGAAALRTSQSISALLRDSPGLSAEASNPLAQTFQEYYLETPIDHFHNDSTYEPHTNETFNLRYWFDATYYKKGGPVYVLSAGEDSGVDRLPYLQKGILHQLAEATGGLAVVLEHRYYGNSFPVANLSTQSLRFLTTDQAMADTDYFARNVVFKDLEHLDLTALGTPYIAYGGSYAGAFVAILRKLYPDTFWGAISSSGVLEAVYDYWQYYEAARVYGPQDCVTATQKLTHIVDNILIKSPAYSSKLKEAFGLENVTYDDDFTQVLSGGISALQSLNWDPAVSSPAFWEYCGNVSSQQQLYPETQGLVGDVRELIVAGGYEDQIDWLVNPFLNFIGYVNVTAVLGCSKSTQDECFTTHNSTFYAQDDISQTWRSWPYQYCTQWGYLQTGRGAPGQLPLISRLMDPEYLSIVCRDAFNITTESDVQSINRHGGYNFSYPRVALLDGERDPWRAATPHALGLPERKSTISEPSLIIKGGVHHWDENGLSKDEVRPGLPPAPVAYAQRMEVKWVQAWLYEWKQTKESSRTTNRGQTIF